MKIVIDLTALDDNFTGIERYALNMALAMLKESRSAGRGGMGNTFALIFKNKVFPDFLPFAEDDRIHFHILKGCRKLLFNQWRLPRYLNRMEADCFLFFAFPMPLLLFGKRVFATIHDMGCWDCPETMKRHMEWYFRLSYRCMARRAEKIITISEFSRGRILDILKVRREKTILAYCGVSENFYGAGEISSQEKQRIREKYDLPETYYLCLSTLEPRKNLQMLLEVYLRLFHAGKVRTKLVLAGRKGWKIGELLSRIDAEKDGQVRVTGFIEDHDLPAVYRMADCFLFPSLYEGFGIPPLEAMSQKVPVIASDSSSLPEILGDGAIYFKNNDAGDLERVLAEFEQTGGARRKERVEAGYERSRKFRYGSEAGKLLEEIAPRGTAGA